MTEGVRLDPERASYLRGLTKELRQAQYLARKAEERIASPELESARRELLDIATRWQDGGSGDLAIAIVAQVARLARALKAPLDLIADAHRKAESLADARKEWGVSEEYDPEVEPDPLDSI